jgi:hypothetical protein
MAGEDAHVVTHDDGWAVEVGGEIASTHSTQDEATQAARQHAEQNESELVIHGEDGQIREKDSEGNDPRDIPG